MAKTALGALILVVAIALLAIFYFSYIKNPAGNSTGHASGAIPLSIRLTDPPKVPSGTQQLLIAYSSVEVHMGSAGNASGSSGWVSATGSGTINLLGLTNASEVIANASVAANSTINLVRFDVADAKIVINSIPYNVSIPSSRITVAITSSQKINSSSPFVLIGFSPAVNTAGRGNSSAYIMAPAATAIVVDGNATISAGSSSSLGSISPLSQGLKLKLSIGLVSGTSAGVNSSSPNTGINVVVRSGEKISNFAVQSINYSSMSVTGLLYVMYPVAFITGVQTTLHVNGTVGYACDNTLAMLTGINSNDTATFTEFTNTSSGHGCPI